jgi:DNA-binding NarL/FixJ family response regulator
MVKPIRVVIADDHEMVRKGLKAWLDSEPDISVVAEGASGRVVPDLIQLHSPDVLMLDLHLPDKHGLDVIKELRAAGVLTPILVMTGYEKQRARAVLLAGANGFLNKEEKRDRIMEAVRWAASGESGTWLSPTAASEWIQSNVAIEKAELTKTELRVLELIELSNSRIAATLFLSEGTVKNHITNIYSKLNLNNRLEAIAWAHQHGLLVTKL